MQQMQNSSGGSGLEPVPAQGKRVISNRKDNFISRIASSTIDAKVERRQALSGHVWNKIVDWIEIWEELEEPERTGCLSSIIDSQVFENVTAAVIVINCGFTAYSSDWSMRHLGEDQTQFQKSAEFFFLCFYGIELMLKITVHGRYFLVNNNALWNMLDLCLVSVSTVDVLITEIASSNGSDSNNIAYMRIFRILKLAKIFRTLRVMRVFKELAVILESFRNCITSLFWCFVMLAFIFYVFALVFLQGATAFLQDHDADGEYRDDVHEFFGSLPTTMGSLYQATTGGDDWGNCYKIVRLTGGFYQCLFLFFIFFFVFAVINILTGIFVEKAVEAAAPDVEGIVLAMRKAALHNAKELKKVCQAMDADSSTTISKEELERGMQTELFPVYLESVGLNVRDARFFFDSLVERYGSAEVSIEDFVDGCLAFKGPASPLDMHRQMYEIKLLHGRLETLLTIAQKRSMSSNGEGTFGEQLSAGGDYLQSLAGGTLEKQAHVGRPRHSINGGEMPRREVAESRTEQEVMHDQVGEHDTENQRRGRKQLHVNAKRFQEELQRQLITEFVPQVVARVVQIFEPRFQNQDDLSPTSSNIPAHIVDRFPLLCDMQQLHAMQLNSKKVSCIRSDTQTVGHVIDIVEKPGGRHSPESINGDGELAAMPTTQPTRSFTEESSIEDRFEPLRRAGRSSMHKEPQPPKISPEPPRIIEQTGTVESELARDCSLIPILS